MILDNLLSYVSWTTVTLAGLSLCLVVYIAQWISEERQIRQLGGHAPRRSNYLPLGIGFLYEGIKYSRKLGQLNLWDKNFRTYGNPSNPYTIEAFPGGRRMIFTADAENIKAVLATQFNDYGKGKRFNRVWHDFLGDGIFSTDHQKWYESRQLIRPQFIKDRVSDLEVFEKHTLILLSKLGGQGQEVDVKDLFFRYTLDAATDFLLGDSVGSLDNPQTGFAEAFAEIQRIQTLISRASLLKIFIPRRAFRQHIRTLNEFVEPFIDSTLALSTSELEQRTKSDHGYTFLHALAGYTRDRTVLRDQLVAVLLAARDTTACTLSWLFLELSKHKEVVDELRKEIGDIVGNRQPTYADLKSMRFLQYTLNETLRLYPAVPFNVRVALQDTTLPHGGGPDGNSPIGILKDTRIAYSTHYLHLTRSIYPPTSDSFPDPLKFAPKRWSTWQPAHWSYIPFNGGPRICVGQQFALTEMGYTVVRILQKFSRVESRMGSIAAGFGNVDGAAAKETSLKNESPMKLPRWGNEESMVEKAGNAMIEKGVGYKAEVVLAPASAVKVAFFE